MYKESDPMKLLDYIRGIRKGKEAHRLQKEAMRDPFLADAMDGYDGVGENQEQQIELLRRRIMMKTKRQQHHAIAWSMAASLLLGVCLSGYFLFQKDKFPENAFIALKASQRDTVLKIVPQMPQLPVLGTSKTDEDMKLAKAFRKDSAKRLITQERKIKKAVAPVAVREETPDEAEMSMAEMDLQASAPVAAVMAVVPDSNVVKSLSGRGIEITANNVKGRVTDKTGEPIIGANIIVRGTNQGTVSDLDGKFMLHSDGDKEIAVNYIGYDPVILPVDTSKEMLIAMNEDKQTLDEVVVVGYGKQKKSSRVGSVATVESLTMPQPVIGKKAYRKYLKANLVHPEDEECAHMKGEVVLAFHVDGEGRPVHIKIQNSLCPSADKEAMRLVREGPQWTVGGKEVVLHIQFE